MSLKIKTFSLLCLLAIGAIPIFAGGLRLAQLVGASINLPESERILSIPPQVLTCHIVSSTTYLLLGAFQFSNNGKRKLIKNHKRMGKLVILNGLSSAISGLWLSFNLPLPPDVTPLLIKFRLIAGIAMIGFILMGVFCIIKLNFKNHGDWMMRSYAIGLGAGTQAIILLIWEGLIFPPSPPQRTLLFGSGWLINVIFVEALIAFRKQTTALRK